MICTSTNLSSIGPFQVDLCDCGAVHVHLGPATFRLTPESLPQLAATLELATQRLPAVQRAIAPPAAPEDHERN